MTSLLVCHSRAGRNPEEKRTGFRVKHGITIKSADRKQKGILEEMGFEI